MIGIALRRAGLHDRDAVVAIDAECFDVPWPTDSWHAELSRSYCTVMLATDGDGGELLGLSCDWCLPDDGHLLRLATRPSARRRGIGRTLLASVVERARRAGCGQVLLEVGAANLAAQRLYAWHGFVEIARRVGYYRAPPDDAIVMRHALSHDDRVRDLGR